MMLCTRRRPRGGSVTTKVFYWLRKAVAAALVLVSLIGLLAPALFPLGVAVFLIWIRLWDIDKRSRLLGIGLVLVPLAVAIGTIADNIIRGNSLLHDLGSFLDFSGFAISLITISAGVWLI